MLKRHGKHNQEEWNSQVIQGCEGVANTTENKEVMQKEPILPGQEEEKKMGAGHAPEEKGSQRLSIQRKMSRKPSMGGNKKKR